MRWDRDHMSFEELRYPASTRMPIVYTSDMYVMLAAISR